MNKSDLQGLCAEARPIIERMMDDAEVLAAFRETATAKGIDWSQVKALLKAQIRDERDGTGKRVRALVERADNATSYADLLGLTQNNYSRSSSETEHALPIPTSGSASPAWGGEGITPDIRTPHAGTHSAPEGDGLGIPEFLRRTRESA